MKLILNFSLKLRLSIVLILCPLFVYGQSSWGKLRLIYNSFLNEQARSLHEQATKKNYAPRSCSFQAIAFPVDKLEKTKIAVDYVNDEFIVRIGNQEFYPDLPDWQLLPIVDFANSPYQGVLALSEKNQNQEAQIKYHPAFLDNLLGLRLLQANLLLVNPELMGEIPKDEEGNAILAISEEGQMPPSNPGAYQSLFGDLKKNHINYDFYVLTDRNLYVSFDIDGNDLVFSDNPYYYFSQSNVTPTVQNDFQKELEPYYIEIELNAKKFLSEKYTPNLNPRTNLEGLLRVLSENKQNEIFNPYALQYINDSVNKLQAALTRSEQKEETDANFQTMDDLTYSLKINWTLLKQYNPLVYSAVENTSHWAAFFRHVRLSNPSNWAAFLKKLENVEMNAPLVHTPTSFVE
jgi:hypothetical protein